MQCTRPIDARTFLPCKREAVLKGLGSMPSEKTAHTISKITLRNLNTSAGTGRGGTLGSECLSLAPNGTLSLLVTYFPTLGIPFVGSLR